MYFGRSMVISVNSGLPDLLSYKVSSILPYRVACVLRVDHMRKSGRLWAS